MKEFIKKCRGCDNPRQNAQWWTCRGHYGISGQFCADCYDMISHDSYGNPNRPGDYLIMLLKLSGKNS